MAEQDEPLPAPDHPLLRIQMGNPPPAKGESAEPQRVEGAGSHAPPPGFVPQEPQQGQAPQPAAHPAPPGFFPQTQDEPAPQGKPGPFKAPPGFVPVGSVDDHLEPGVQVSDDPIHPAPSAVGDRVRIGNTVYPLIPRGEAAQQSGLWDTIGDALHSFHDAIDLGPAWEKATEESFAGGVQSLKDAANDILSGRPASAVLHGALGALGTGLAPVNGLAMAVGDKIAAGVTNITGNKEFGDKVGALVGLAVGGSPVAEAKVAAGMTPLLKDKAGNFHKIVEENGQVTIKKLGPPPVEDDFHKSAAKIAPDATPARQARIAKILKKGYNRDGNWPAEYEEAAAQSPVVAKGLSADATTPRVLPARPNKAWLEDLENRFTRLKGAYTADRLEMNQLVKRIPKAFKNEGTQAEWYRVGEGAPVDMTQEEIEAYNKYLVPLKKEEAENWEALQSLKYRYASEGFEFPFDIGEYDPTYMHRMVKGKTPEVDVLTGNTMTTDPSKYAQGSGLLGRTPGSMKERRYFTMVNQNTGERVLVLRSDDGKVMTDITKGAPGGKNARMWKVKDAEGEMTPKGEVKEVNQMYPGLEVKTGEGDAQETWKVAQAWTDEIEAHTSTRYYKNALAVTIDNILKQRAARRAIQELENLRASEEWRAYTMPKGTGPGLGHNGGPPIKVEGSPGVEYISPEAAPFKNDHMDPRLANVIDDFFAPESTNAFYQTLQNVNDIAIGSLFWSGIPHMSNAAAWWFTERGWANYSPRGMASLFRNSARALHQVATLGKDYQMMLKEGSSLIRGGLDNPRFYRQLMEQTGTAIAKQEGFWHELGHIAGVPTVDLVKSWYRWQRNILWNASDFFAMQRTYELMDLRGISMRQAIEEMERTMPNYRVHSNMAMDYLPGKAGQFLEGAGRATRDAMTRSIVTEFGRYNQNVMRGFTNMAVDLVGPKASLADRVDALGKVLALGTLGMVVYPAISWAWHELTGWNDQWATFSGPGKFAKHLIGDAVQHDFPIKYPQFIRDYYKDMAPDLPHAVISTLANSPAVKAADAVWSATTGTPMHTTGRPFIEPADKRNWRWVEMLSQGASAAGKIGIEPLNAVDEWAKHGYSLNDFLMHNIMGAEISDEKSAQARNRAFLYQEKQSLLRKIRPASPLEGWMHQQLQKIIEGDK